MDASEIGLQEFDRQQELLLETLRRAAGAPVSYADLREAGVDLPASVVSELELAGVAIERCAAGVRLDPAEAPAPHLTPDPAAPPTGNAPRKSRLLAISALLAAAVVASSLVVISRHGGGHQSPPRAPARTHSPATVASAAARPPVLPRPTRPEQPPVPVSPALATELEAQGHDLLQAGDYGAAVPVLKRAVLATGENLGACLEPTSSTCLTYAYALYDLGRAVRLGGAPQAAVPILERRLQIDNQRWVVSDELQLARQGVG